LVAVIVLALGLGGVALAQRSTASVQANVTLRDGKVEVSPATFTPGKLTFVAVNMGSLSHALAIMGTGLQPKRTAAIGSGKTARLTVTLKVGLYHVWDPIRGSMSHATMLMVKAANATSTGSSTSSSGSKSSSGSTSGGSTSGGTSSGGTTGTGGAAPSTDPCAGM